MTNINTNYNSNVKAMDYDVPAGPNFAELQERIQQALAQIESFEYAEYLTEEQLAEMNRIKTMLKAQSAAIAGYGINGQAPVMGNTGTPGYWNQPAQLQPEWNGIPPEFMNTDCAVGMGLIDDPNMEFAGTVTMPNSGVAASPNIVGFQMTEDMVALSTVSKGRHIMFIAEYQDGTKRAWLLWEGTVRPEPIVISAFGLGHGVTIDCSRTIRVSDGHYASNPNSGLIYIHGTEHDDVIYGHMGNTRIVGYAGDDYINGVAGDNIIYGDEYYEYAGQFDPAYGGNDTIVGGAGYDQIYGGGGIDTAFSSDAGEAVHEVENWVNDVAASVPPTEDWFHSQGGTWEVQDVIQNGMVEIHNVGGGEGGKLQISMPPGYHMAIAEPDDANNLIITFVGEAGTLKVKIVGFFQDWSGSEGDVASKIVSLEFLDSEDDDIIDFSRVELTSQSIHINCAYGGDDIILGARYKMISDGLDPNNLLTSQGNSTGMLNQQINNGLFTDDSKDDYEASVGQDGQINIKKKEGASQGSGFQVVDFIGGGSGSQSAIEKLGLVAPPGYDIGYLTYDNQGNMYVILVNKGAGGSAKSIVFKIDASLGLGADDIAVYHSANGGASMAFMDLIALHSNSDFYAIDGGDGSDFIVTQKNGSVKHDPNDHVAEYDYDYLDYSSSSSVNSTGPSTETDETDEADDTDEVDETDETDETEE